MADIRGTYNFTLRGKPAQMLVIRNNGYCWGRLLQPGEPERDVVTNRDYYDWGDDDAALKFINAARRRPASIQPAAAVRGWEYDPGAPDCQEVD